jgi:hypothetical protein
MTGAVAETDSALHSNLLNLPLQELVMYMPGSATGSACNA